MVRLYCDRCGREIKKGYYHTVNINKTEIYYKDTITELAEVMASCTSIRKSPYEELSSQVMYCEECKDDIEYYINNRETEEDKELRKLCEFENLSD